MSSAEPSLGAGPRAQPAWKREILERKRAKLAGAAGAEAEPPAAAAARAQAAAAAPGERLVVAESLGPLHENPFMRLESERRRLRQGLPGGRAGRGAARPLQQLLELYSAVPGIRTIRADNILIIESQPEAAAAACFAAGAAPPARRPEPPPAAADPLRELLARKGAALAEIRAEQVFIYEAAEAPEAAEPGTVSRLLEKFGQRPRGRRRRGGEEAPGSTPGSPRATPGSPRATPGSPRATPGSPRATPGSPRAAPGSPQATPGSPPPAAPTAAPPSPQAAPVAPLAAPEPPPPPPAGAAAPQPLPGAAPARPAAPRAPAVAAAAAPARCFLHKIGSNSFTVTPRGLPPGSRAPEAAAAAPAGRTPPPKAPPVPSARANARRPKPEEAEAAASPPPSATVAPSATGSSQPLSAAAPKAGGSFEILPAPKPDLAAIPAHDLQAQALAKLRLNSRNSFVFVPRREGGPAPQPPALRPTEGPPPGPEVQQDLPRASAKEREEAVAPPPAPRDAAVPITYIDDIVEPDSGELSPRGGAALRTGALAEQPREAASDLEMEFSSVPLYKPHAASPQRGGSTFTVVPKRKPVASGSPSAAEAGRRPQCDEDDDDEEEGKGRGKAVENADGSHVGTPLKKRYPTVNEIEVIGGYLSLERSCMSKTGRRKKMKISFNETSLQTMFEYPSESSLAEEEEEEEGHASETEEDKNSTYFIPCPNSTLDPSTPNSDLSSYTPKHSVKFSNWQEQKYEEVPNSEGALRKETDSAGTQVMLTPAEKGGLSDFSSEPALYF